MNNDLYELCESIDTSDANFMDTIKLMLKESGIEGKYIFNEIIFQYIEQVKYNRSSKDKYDHIFMENTLLKNSLFNNYKSICTQPTQIQRSPEWFAARKNRVTASEFASLFGSKAKWNELMKKKCINSSTNNFFTGDAILHGKKFETIVQYEYMIKNDTDIKEFGCLIHHKYDFIGASPDGIDIKDYTMIEIKCPKSRIIRHLPTYEYWCQMQLQLEVANLNKCIFIECKLELYENETEFIQDTSDNKLFSKKGYKKGVVIVIFKIGEEEDYIYPPICILKSREQHLLLSWVKEQCDLLYKDGNISGFRKDFYYIEGTYEIMIYRNRNWFWTKFEVIKKFWDEVLEARKDKRFENIVKNIKKPKPSLFDECLFD